MQADHIQSGIGASCGTTWGKGNLFPLPWATWQGPEWGFSDLCRQWGKSKQPRWGLTKLRTVVQNLAPGSTPFPGLVCLQDHPFLLSAAPFHDENESGLLLPF